MRLHPVLFALLLSLGVLGAQSAAAQVVINARIGGAPYYAPRAYYGPRYYYPPVAPPVVIAPPPPVVVYPGPAYYGGGRGYYAPRPRFYGRGYGRRW